jgi:DNA-binding LacI/PurR family transcriptional regulator
VTTDDVRVGELATEHLIRMGHKQIGHLRGAGVSTALKRFDRYAQALSKNGLRLDSTLVRECGFTEPEGYSAMQRWLKEGGVPSAIFAANDPAAIGAMAAISEAGMRVPEDVAIVGGGNIHYGDMLQVPLTTVSWSKTEMGQLAARLLMDLIDGKKKRDRVAHHVVKPELIIRRSCGAHSH